MLPARPKWLIDCANTPNIYLGITKAIIYSVYLDLGYKSKSTGYGNCSQLNCAKFCQESNTFSCEVCQINNSFTQHMKVIRCKIYYVIL